MNKAKEPPTLDTPLRIESVGHIDFGTIKGFGVDTAEGIVDLTEPPPALTSIKPRSISVSFETNFVKGPGWHFLNNLYKRSERERFRRLRPYRKAKRRALSRKRIEATRGWHSGSPLRGIYSDLFEDFGLGGLDWENDQRNPYKGVRPSKR